MLHGHKAMAVPLRSYYGSWVETKDSDDRIEELLEYLDNIKFEQPEFELKRREINIYQHRLRFDSNIPLGYGLGSSGALTAALFDRFIACPRGIDLVSLKNVLGQIESYFHGSSSGTDPLVSYLNQAFILSPSSIEMTDATISDSCFEFYLYDSGLKRNTANLVRKYQSMRKSDTKFLSRTNDMGLLNDKLIDALVLKDPNSFLENFVSLSELQFEIMKDFIPEFVKKDWKAGLESKAFYMKLCGAGGGGFFLILNRSDDDHLMSLFGDRVSPVFK